MNIPILLLFHEGRGLATVLLVSAQLYTHSSSLARALVCHRIKLKVMNQARIQEAGANHTQQEEECRILWQGGSELWWMIIPNKTNFLKVSLADDKKRKKKPQCKLVHISKNWTLKSHQIWHIQCSKYYKALRRKSGGAESSYFNFPMWFPICFSIH